MFLVLPVFSLLLIVSVLQGVRSFWKWETALPQIISDERYDAVESFEDKKKVFKQFQEELVQQENVCIVLLEIPTSTPCFGFGFLPLILCQRSVSYLFSSPWLLCFFVSSIQALLRERDRKMKEDYFKLLKDCKYVTDHSRFRYESHRKSKQ